MLLLIFAFLKVIVRFRILVSLKNLSAFREVHHPRRYQDGRGKPASRGQNLPPASLYFLLLGQIFFQRPLSE